MAGFLLTVAVLSLPAQSLGTAAPAPVFGGRGVAEAVTYIKTHQNADGGFSEPDAASDTMTTCWALIAGASAGQAPLSWTKGGATAQTYLDGIVGSTTSLRDFEMMTIALEEAGGDPRKVAGRDLVSLVKANLAGNGRIGSDVSEHCWGVLALATVGDTVPANCAQWLLGQRRQDGGWGESDQVVTMDTALAVQALIATDEQSADAVASALDLLRSGIGGDGGFKGPTSVSDAQTTAAVIEAVRAGGEDPTSQKWSFQANNPLKFIESLQAGDGHFQFSKGVESQPMMTSAIASPAVSGDYFPLAAADSNSGTNNGSQVTGDMGTAGSATTNGSSSQSDVGSGNGPNMAVKVLRGSASGAEGSATGATGLWVFLVVCGVYALLLLVLVLLVRRMFAGGRPESARIVTGAAGHTGV